MWKWITAVAAIIIVGLGGTSLWLGSDREQAGASQASVPAEQLTDGKALYEVSCASCHGIKGEGQPNWKSPNEQGIYPAPPHDNDGHTWHHSDQQLLEIMAQGGSLPATAMPGFEGTLDQVQMEAILTYIKTFWGREQRDFQEQVTRSRQPQTP